MIDGQASSAELDRFNRALGKYLEWNKREAGPLIEKRGRSLRFALYREYAAIAPSRAKIDADAGSRNYAIKRRFRNGKRLTVKEEIALRKRGVKYLSVSFLHSAWRHSREGRTATFTRRSRLGYEIGEAIVRTAKGNRRPSVRITSMLAGAAAQNRERRIVDRALNAEGREMEIYIARKQREAIQKLVTAPFR